MHGILEIPERRGLTLRELASVLLATSRSSWSLLRDLKSNELGPADAELLKDGSMTELYEWVLDRQPGSLGFINTNAFLDRPSPEATRAVCLLLACARSELNGLDFDDDQHSVDAIFRAMFRKLLLGAGRSPEDPSQDGWIQPSAEPALTSALGDFSIQCGVTVGQSVAEVAWVSEGVVYDSQKQRAANCYQPREPRHLTPTLAGAAGGGGGIPTPPQGRYV